MSKTNEDICRLCLSKEGFMLPIFKNHSSKNEISFRSKLMKCVSIEVYSDDNLPSKVCHLCFHSVEKFFHFQTMCENSDAVLQSQLKQIEGNNKFLQDVNSQNEKTTNENFNSNTFLHQFTSNNFKSNINFEAYNCFACLATFESIDSLINHLTKTHPSTELFFCKACKNSSTSIQQFKNHLTLQHSLNCYSCDEVFKSVSNYQNHIKIHNIEKIVCKFCKKLFSDKLEAKKHEEGHIEKSCSYCSKEFDSKQELQIHLGSCNQLYACKFCDKTVKSKKDLIEHVNDCHDGTTTQICGNCKKSYSKFDDHKCEIDAKYQCKSCDSVFLDEISLTSHTKNEHNGDVLSCSFCMKTFSLRSSLKRHEKSHSGVKPYQCKYCPRKFKDSSACVVHTRTHTGEHPFRCQECNKDFKQLANLKMHTYRHHKKNRKLVEEKNEVIPQESHDYEHLYTDEMVESYTAGGLREYQQLNESLQTNFNPSMNILIPEHP